MSLHNTDALIIEAGGAGESLPDPTTVAGRTHELKNNANVAQTWSSVGATPFVVGGVNSTTLVLAVGQEARLYSNGTRWVVLSVVSRREFAGNGVTDAGGNVTFNFIPPFSVVPEAVSQIGPSADTALVEARLTSLTAAAATFNVRRSPSVVILGISVLQVPQNAPGVTVHCIATEPGQGV